MFSVDNNLCLRNHWGLASGALDTHFKTDINLCMGYRFIRTGLRVASDTDLDRGAYLSLVLIF